MRKKVSYINDYSVFLQATFVAGWGTVSADHSR